MFPTTFARRSPLGLRELKLIEDLCQQVNESRSPLGLRELKHVAGPTHPPQRRSQPAWAA